MVLTGILVGALVLVLVAAFVDAWRDRPYRGTDTEDENARRDETALQADSSRPGRTPWAPMSAAP